MQYIEEHVEGFRVIRVEVKVDRAVYCGQTIKKMRDEHGWDSSAVKESAVKIIPYTERVGEETVSFIFFTNGQGLRLENIQRARKILKLSPDAQAQAVANQNDPRFSEEHVNGYAYKGPDDFLYRLIFYGQTNGLPGNSIFCQPSQKLEWPTEMWYGGREITPAKLRPDE